MSWKVTSSSFGGKMKIPSSKSQSIRALLFALLAQGKSVLGNLLPSPDVHSMILACKQLGAKIEKHNQHYEIIGVGGKILSAEDVIQAGNSGLILRLIGAVAGLCPLPIVITGDYSIRHIRPVSPLLDALSQLGAHAVSLRADGGAPILVKGPIYPGCATMDGSDSQPVSALLIAGAFAPGPIEIFVTNPGEKPWVNLTLSWLDRCKIPFKAENYTYYRLEGNASIEGFSYISPADFSSLSYPLVAAILTGSELLIENIDFSDPQGDKKILSILQEMGAAIEIDADNKNLIVKKCTSLRGISINVNDCIDATPLLAVAGCFAEGQTEIKGAAIARKKESDRLSCIAKELKKMGAKIDEKQDGLTIYHSSLRGAEVYSFKDHRIALSLAVAGMVAKGETLIHEIDCTAKSFPHFCKEMQKVGANIAHH